MSRPRRTSCFGPRCIEGGLGAARRVWCSVPDISSIRCHSGAPRSGEPGIHSPCAGVMDSGFLATPGPAMTIPTDRVTTLDRFVALAPRDDAPSWPGCVPASHVLLRHVLLWTPPALRRCDGDVALDKRPRYGYVAAIPSRVGCPAVTPAGRGGCGSRGRVPRQLRPRAAPGKDARPARRPACGSNDPLH